MKAGSSASSDTADLGDVESDEVGNRTPRSGSEDESGSSGEVENGSSLTSVGDEDEDAAMNSRGRARRRQHQVHIENVTKPRATRGDLCPRVNGSYQNGPASLQSQVQKVTYPPFFLSLFEWFYHFCVIVKVEDWTQSPSLWASRHGVPPVFYSNLPPGIPVPPQQELQFALHPYIPAGLAAAPNLEEMSRMHMAARPPTEVGLAEELFRHQLQQQVAQQVAALQAVGLVFQSPLHPFLGQPLGGPPVALLPPADHLRTDIPMLMRQQPAVRPDPVQRHNQALLEQALAEQTAARAAMAAQWTMNPLLPRPDQAAELAAYQQLLAEQDRQAYAQHEFYERVRQELLLNDRQYQMVAAEAMLNGFAPGSDFSRQPRVHPNPS